VLYDATPQRLGRYELLTLIAAGGMAQVYAGRILGESGFAKLVAVKVMLDELLDEDRFVAMFLDEARVAAHISHPHVVGMLDLGRDARGVPYLVMDLVIGASVAQLLKGDGTVRPEAMPVGHAVEIIAQVAEGLHAAHEAKDTLGTPLEIVHRDVSPQNILVGVDGRARITDFGVARAVARLTRTTSGEVKGKARYFSPEQALGRDVDRRSDLFSLGIVLWETLALRPLFQGKSMLEVHKAVVSQPIPDVRELRPDVPASVAEVIAHALERDPALRVATGADLARDLRAAAERARLALPRPTALTAYVQARAGHTVATLTSEIREKTAALDIDVGELTGTDTANEEGAGFDDEEPTAIDAEIVQKMMKGGASTTRPGLNRPRQIKSLAEPITSSSPTLRSVAPFPMPASPALPEIVPEESSVAPTTLRLPTGASREAPRSLPTVPHGTTAAAGAAREVPAPTTAAPLSSPRPMGPASPREGAGGQMPLRPGFAAAPPSVARATGAEPGDDRSPVASRALAALGYVALAIGAVGVAFDPLFVPSTLAVVAAVAYFALVASSPERRAAMGAQLAVSAVCASIGLVLGLFPLVVWALVSVGLVPAGLAP
jgi:serine/threonine-protein kinase